MSEDQIVLLAVGLIVIAAVAVTVAFATASPPRRDVNSGPGEIPTAGLRDHDDGMPDPTRFTAGVPGGELQATGAPRPSSSLISPTSTRQVARVVAFLYLASVAVVVALTDAWSDTEPAIFTLLAVGSLLVVMFMDLVPPAALGRWRRPVEGIGAIIFLGLLTALTGGAGSPFFVGYFLVVAGTALSTEGRAPLAIALLASATVALVGVVDAIDSPIDAQTLAWVGFNAVALVLLADIATAASRAQRHARDEALRASRFDGLTGLLNRAFFFTTMEQEIRRSDRMGRGFTTLMLDLDDLKPVNDTFGHQWGDRLLRAVADAIRQTIRFTDAAARYGGDEFVILLPETDAAGGYVVGEKLRRDIAAVTLRAADRNVRSTVSVGLVTYPDDGRTIEQLVAAADVAMYESKRRGKNRIVGYQTRTERVATAIDIDVGGDTAAERPPAPPPDVRAGGDPAPWGALPSGSDSLTVTDTARAPSPSPTPVLPPSPERTRPRPIERVSEPSRSPTVDAPVDPVDATPSDQPWLTRTTDARTPPPRHPTPEPGPTAEPRPPEAPQQRPAADHWSSGGSSGRSPSRSEEIRSSGERPWIALPIEPWEPPERPRG